MSDPPKGLPEPPDGITGLPEPQVEVKRGERAVDKARKCKQCGKDARIVSKSGFRQAYCGPCKLTWPIGPAPDLSGPPLNMPRGLSKQTLVEPDWNMAYEEIGTGEDESFGPKKKG